MVLFYYEKVYNFDIADNENYYVTEDGILVHNGYISDRQGTIIDRKLLNKPTKRGNAPTFKEDGTSVELHHRDQNPEGPFDEMHWLDHRGKGNYTINHQKKGEPSLIDRDILKNKNKNTGKKYLIIGKIKYKK